MKKSLLFFIYFLFTFLGTSQNTDLAKEVNLKPFCPIPGNQNGVNACVGYAMGYGAMTILNSIQSNDKSKEFFNQHCFSPYFLFNQTLVDSFDCNKGASYQRSVELLKNKGNCFIQDFDVRDNCHAQPDQRVIKKAQSYKILSGGVVFDERDSAAQKIKLIKSFLQDSIPVVINFEVFESFTQIENGLTNWSKKSNDSYKAHHGLLVVGYDSTSFEVMNSWGTEWGNGGFIKMTYKELADNTLRAYAISFKPIPDNRFYTAPVGEGENAVTSCRKPDRIFIFPDNNIRKKSISLRGKTLLSQTIGTLDGSLLTIGSIESQKSTQMFVRKFSEANTNLLQYTSKVDEWEDEFGVTVLELPDSNIVAGGYSLSKNNLYANKAWLTFLDPSGKKGKRKIIKKSATNLSLESIQRDKDQLTCVGIENQNLWLVITDLAGNVVSKNNQFRKQSNDFRFQSAKLLITDEAMFVYGAALVLSGKPSLLPSEDAYSVPYLLKLNKKGELIKQTLFLDLEIETVGNISKGYNDHLMMIGTLAGKEKYYFLRIPKDLDKSKMVLTKNGTTGSHIGIDMIALANGKTLVMGNTNAYEKGGRTLNIFLNKLDQYGQAIWSKPWIFGGRYEERGVQLIEGKNKSIWISGIHETGKMTADLLALCIGEPVEEEESFHDLKRIKIEPKNSNKNIQLAPKEVHVLSYQLLNERTQSVSGLEMEMTCIDCPSHLIFPSKQIIPSLNAQQTLLISKKIKTKRKVIPGTNKIQVRFFNKANQLVFEEVILIEIVKNEAQPFVLYATRINSIDTTNFRPGKEAVMLVSFKSGSKATRRNISLKFDFPEQVVIDDATSFTIDTWGRNEVKMFKLKFTPEKSIQPRLFEVKAFIRFGKDEVTPFVIKPQLDTLRG